MFQLGRHLGAIKTGLSVGVLLLFFLTLHWAAQDPVYEFRFHKVDHQHDAALLLRLKADLERLDNTQWSFWALYDDQAGPKSQTEWNKAFSVALAEIIKNDPDAATGADLIRASSFSANAAGRPVGNDENSDAGVDDSERLTTLNAVIDLLGDRLNSETLSEYRSLEVEESAKRIEVQLSKAHAARRDRAARRLATAPEIEELFSLYEMPPFPSAERDIWAKLRRFVGKKTPAKDLWIQAFCSEGVGLEKIHRFRMALRGSPEIPAGSKTAAGDQNPDQLALVLRPEKQIDSAGITAEFGRATALTDCSLLMNVSDAGITATEVTIHEAALATSDRQTAVEGPMSLADANSAARPGAALVQVDSGIDLVGLLVFQMPDGSLAYQWPPETAIVDLAQFSTWIHRLGLPDAFSVRDLSVRLRGNPNEPAIDLACVIYHNDALDLAWPVQFSLDLNNADATIRDFRQAELLTAIDRLTNELPELEALNGLHTHITAVDGEPGVFQCDVHYPAIGQLTFGLGISPQGAIMLSGNPRTGQRRGLAAYLCKGTELDGLAHLVRVDSIVPVHRRGPVGAVLDAPLLEGELTLLASAVDAGTDISGIQWHAGPTPDSPRLSLDGRALASLRGVRTRLQQIPRSDPNDASLTAEQIAQYLGATYPALRGAVEVVAVDVTEQGFLVRLALLIGEWPEVTLGPVVMNADNFGRQIDALLQPDQIVQAANAQWSKARTHSRYGHVLAEMLEWTATGNEAQARIQCSVPISFLDARDDAGTAWLPWVETQRYLGGNWKRFLDARDSTLEEFSMRELCQVLEPRLAALEGAASDVVYQVSGQEVVLKVERDAFGDGIFMRLNPFAIRVRIGLKIPLVPVEVTARNILVDQRQIHYPEEFSATYRRTFGVPNPVTPSFNLSDPMISINWARSGLKIGCKITPPCPPVFGPIGFTGDADVSTDDSRAALESMGIPIPFRQIRTDNLMLHVIYLEGELGGRLQDRTLSAKAEVHALGEWNIGRGRLRADFDEMFVDGYVEAGTTLPRLFPLMNGDFRISAVEGMRMRGLYRVAGVDVEGMIKYRTQVEPWLIELTGRGYLPGVGQVEIHGESDLAFDNAKIWARGIVPATRFAGLGEMRYEFFASSTGGYRLSFFWTDPVGEMEFSYTHSGYAVDELDEATVERELRRYKSTTADRPNRTLSQRELRAIARLPRMSLPSPPEPPSISDLFAKEDLASFGGGQEYVRIPNLKWSTEYEAGLLHIFTPGSAAGPTSDLFELRLSDCAPIDPFKPGFELFARQHYSGTGGVVLLVDSQVKALRLLELSSKTNVVAGMLTEKFDEVRTSLEKLQPFGDDDRAKVARRAVARYTALLIDGTQPEVPVEIAGGGFLIAARPGQDGEAKNSCYLWSADGQVYEIGLTESILPPGPTRKAFFERVRTLRPKPRGQLVFMGQQKPYPATLLHPTTEPNAFELTTTTIPQEKPFEPLRLEITGIRPQLALMPLLEAFAAKLYGESDRGHYPMVALVGDGGICGISEHGLSIMCFAHDQPLLFLPDEKLIDWEHPNSRFLPARLGTRELRETCWKLRPQEFAEQFIRSWNSQRQLEEWGANPFGMAKSLEKPVEDDSQP